MSLSRSTPLEPNRSHSWSEPDADGWRTCEHNGCRVRWWWLESPDHPPRSVCYGGLARGSGLSRSKGVRPRAEREKRAHQRDEGYREFVRRQPCVVCGATPCDPAHVKNWGAGWGDWLPGGDGNVVSLCRRHHDLSENEIGWGPDRFAEEFDVDLADEARRIGERYQQEREAA